MIYDLGQLLIAQVLKMKRAQKYKLLIQCQIFFFLILIVKLSSVIFHIQQFLHGGKNII